MRTRVSIGILSLGAAAFAGLQSNLAAAYVALGVGAILYVLHSIEFKINKLLDERQIRVLDSEIAKD
jgi:hypothetical protein